MKPSCFDSDWQWQQWLTQHALAPTIPRPLSDELNYCQDCTRRYQQEMLASGRCAHPGTKFALVNEPSDGKAPRDREVIGLVTTVIPLTAENFPMKAAKRGSGPSSQRIQPAPNDLTPPIREPSPQAVALLEEAERVRRDVLALTGVEPGTEPERSQS